METSHKYSIETCATLAEMHGPYKMSAHSCGLVFTHIAKRFCNQPDVKTPSIDTINRCIVESMLCCKYEIVAWIGESEDLALAFDGSRHKSRNQVDIIIAGVLPSFLEHSRLLGQARLHQSSE